MKIELKTDGFIAGTELSQFAECCAAFELGTFMSQVESVLIHLANVEGAGDEKNKSCQVTVVLSGRDKVFAWLS
ncbi:MAG: hypothetical protein ACO3DT_14370 [Gammaproteobacteria bacterium]